MKVFNRIILWLGVSTAPLCAQESCAWQQHASYKMQVEMQPQHNAYHARQELTYTNHSPDTLRHVFYHLYYNAFAPNSEMDVRLQHIPDPDARMVNNLGTQQAPRYQSKIAVLSQKEKGGIEIQSLKQEGQPLEFFTVGTVLAVPLAKPILPGGKTVLQMEYQAQIPPMIRRTGHSSSDGVAFTMTQWYPKLAEYDALGWRTNQYIAREFYGVWADYEVSIVMDEPYVIAGTGVLQGVENIVSPVGKKKKNQKSLKKWTFTAHNVHDFAWAADPDFQHDSLKTPSGKTLNFFYKKYPESWKQIQPQLLKVFEFYNQKIGAYPWEQYSFIQGGDGGMEYAMCTMVAGGENPERLLNTCIHELGHAWFQHIFASDEQMYPWFDEGFTTYIENWATNEVISPDPQANFNTHEYKLYQYLVQENLQEAPTTHADFYATNAGYSITSYAKGALFVSQLGYIIGTENLEKTFRRFYQEYALKHCTPQDFIRCAERVSGMQLRWFYNEFMQTTHTIDYAIESVMPHQGKTRITLRRLGRVPMPLDLLIVPQGEKPFALHIPTALTFGVKENPFKNMSWEVLSAWGWAQPTYTFEVDVPYEQVQAVVIDPMDFMADVNKQNNTFPSNASQQ